MSGHRRRVEVVPSEDLADIALSTPQISQSSRAIAPQLQLIESSKATERARGVEELAGILRDDAHNGGIMAASFTPSAWEHIITWTVRIIIKEAQSYVNKFGDEWPDISPGAERLCSRIHTQYSGHVRHIWIAAMPYLSAKPTRFLIKHITGSLAQDPCLSHVFCLDYAKVLGAWAAHEPHVRNCKDSRADDIIDLCIRSLSKFGSMPESQASVESSIGQSILPGDLEYAQVLSALVLAAKPVYLNTTSQRVMNFCAEYFRFHVRESGCSAVILDTANSIMLFQPEKYMYSGLEHIKGLLSSSLRLWQTRSAILKHSALYTIRITTRILAHVYTLTKDADILSLLSLSLKTISTGSWDRFKFMCLPHELLSIWCLVDEPNASSNSPDWPRWLLPSKIFCLHSVINPLQLAFFDTAAYLVALLSKPSLNPDIESTEHRNKRSRSIYEPILRLLTTIESDDLLPNARGAAQVLWFTVNVYSGMLDGTCLAELLYNVRSLVQKSDMRKRGELAEWVLGIYRSLSGCKRLGSIQDDLFVSSASDVIWSHGIAGVGAGLYGTAGLLFDMLHRCDGPSDLAHDLCRQASDALTGCPHSHQPDVVQLLMLVAQYISRGDHSVAETPVALLCAQFITRFCQHAAQSKWSIDLFARISKGVFGFRLSLLQSADNEARDPQCCLSLPDPSWNTELQFTRVQHVLAAFSDDLETCKSFLVYHSSVNPQGIYQGLSPSRMSTHDRFSNLSPMQWQLVFKELLKNINKRMAADTEYDHVSDPAMPYISFILSEIHTNAKQSPCLDPVTSINNNIGSNDSSAKMEAMLAQRLDSLVSNAKDLPTIWRLLSFISSWKGAYSCIADLESQVEVLFNALFDSSNSDLLCALSVGDLAGKLIGGPHSHYSQMDIQAYKSAEKGRSSISSNLNSIDFNEYLSTLMESVSLRLVYQPWRSTACAISEIVAHQPRSAKQLAKKLESAIACLGDTAFLVSCELLAHCVNLCVPTSKSKLLDQLKARLLSFLDSYNHIGHAPTLFCVLQMTQGILCASAEGEDMVVDENMPRFVAWICEEANGNLLDAPVEVFLVRSLLGSWTRKENPSLLRALSILDFSANDILVRCAQKSLSFAVRITAEEQLASLGLALPYLQSNARIVYPESPRCDADDTLVLMTRNLGLSMLSIVSGSVIPGALTISLLQIQPQSGCPHSVVRLCHRLLLTIATLSGFSSTEKMIACCASDIFSIEPDLFPIIRDALAAQKDAGTWDMVCVELAVEWMMRGDLEKAKSVLPQMLDGNDDCVSDECACTLLAHSVVLSITDPELYNSVRETILVPYVTDRRMERFARDTPEAIILCLLCLCMPGTDVSAEMNSTLVSVESKHGQMHIARGFVKAYDAKLKEKAIAILPQTAGFLAQWGRRYSASLICDAIDAVALAGGGTSALEFMNSSRAAWIVARIHTSLSSALYDDERLRLVCSLCLFVRILHADTLDSPLFQAVIFRTAFDSWLFKPGRTDAICCLVLCVILDSSSTTPPHELFGMIGTGLMDALVKHMSQGYNLGIDALSVTALACMIEETGKAAGANPLSSSSMIFVDTGLETLCDWSHLSSMVVTKGTIRAFDDRTALLLAAKTAVHRLEMGYCSLACAEILVESIERIVKLALPLDTKTSRFGLANPDDGEGSRINLATHIVHDLLSIRKAIFRYLERHDNTVHERKYISAMLIRSLSLLTIFENGDEGTIGDRTASVDSISKEGDVSWHICNIVTHSRNLDAVLAAIDVASKLLGAKLPESDAAQSALSLEWANASQKQIMRDVAAMPRFSSVQKSCATAWIKERATVELDTTLLEALCSPSIDPDSAISGLVCALAMHRNGRKFKLATSLILADSHAASCLLPHVIHEVVLEANQAEREEISSFLLDFAYNWHLRAPRIARDTIFRTLETRQLSSQFSDIRGFFVMLPLAFFEMADLAVKLDMPKTAAFLLECDLTCTNTERQPVLADISTEAKGLLRSVYHGLGNLPAAQLLEPVGSVSEIMQRCRDTGDWRTLLLYQEAASRESVRPFQNGLDPPQSTVDKSTKLDIGDTLVHLGLLNSIRPELSWVGDGSKASYDSSQRTVTTSAAFAASWRLSKWDVPSLPIAQQNNSTRSCLFLTTASGAEESLYNMFKLRQRSQPFEAKLTAQNYISSPGAITGITVASNNLHESWSYHTVSMLLPLITSCGRFGQHDANEFVHVSQITELLISRSRASMSAKALVPVYSANLILHEIAICDADAQEQSGPTLERLFGRYKEAVHSACVVSRQTGNWQASMNNIFRLRSLSQTIKYDDRILEPELRLWEAETLWDAGNRNMAVELLQSHKKAMEGLLQQAKAGQIEHSSAHSGKTAASSLPMWTDAEIETATILLSKIILTVGEWSDKQRKERPAVLWEEYFNKSAQLLQGVNSPTAWTGRALNALAEFSERQCEELTTLRDNEASGAVRKQKSRELAACQQQLSRASSSTEMSRLKAILRRLEIQVNNDQKELAELRSNIGGFLRLAVWSFVKCLECCHTFDDSVYSLVSLIMTHARVSELHSVLSSGLLDSVPSHKLLPLAHQLCARLGTEGDAFHSTLAHLVHRMSVDYPYHMLYHLFALRNANRTSSTNEASRNLRRTGSFMAQQSPESEKMEQRRSEAATSIIVGITANNPELGSIVRAIEELCNMYIELAVTPVPEKYRSSKLEGRLIEFSSKLKIKKLVKNLPPNIPVLTATPRAETPRDYMSVPFISTIADGYTLAGGINLPKITRVLGTDGRRYKQLVKGKDDMRQDAIIEQLFHVINRCMSSAKRKAPGLASSSSSILRVRTYQVVPLTKRCGVLQWVDNTVPLGNWFREKEEKYRPGAPPMAQLRSMIHDVHKDKATSAQQKLEVLEDVCRIAPPVFRFFFYENFYDSQSWFEHREMYICSAAVSSIAGWVLGIGDRHLQNILMDRSTAEVVHIDLGIAFDLGKLLPIPELVPFRLTREMIDGMGLLGLQGTFQSTCQTALEVMRMNSRVVITILNVLKVDPLYMWSLIPLRIDKMNRTAGGYVDELRDGSRISSTPSDIGERDVVLAEETDAAAAEDENKEAWRSIIHVGQRLDARISAEGQVSELIQQATDPMLLSRMFEGWSAWY